MAEGTETADQFAAALAALREAHGRAVEALRALPANQDAFKRASELADSLRELAEAAAEERAVTAARIAEEEKLSLAGLAAKISVSRGRAGQLVQTAKKARQRSTESERDYHDA